MCICLHIYIHIDLSLSVSVSILIYICRDSLPEMYNIAHNRTFPSAKYPSVAGGLLGGSWD